MLTSTPERIQALTASGVWPADTLHGLLKLRVMQHPDWLAAADQPNKTELTGSDPARLTFRELDTASDALAAQLLAHGVNESSRVMVQLPNIVELIVCFFATSKLGAVISPLPVQYGEHEIRSLASALNPDVFISCTNFRGEDFSAKAAAALPETPVLQVGSDIDCLRSDCSEADCSALAVHCAKVGDDPHRIVTVCWTSGTTGTPKGVPRSHAMWLATARATAEAGDYRIGERFLNPFPLVNMAAIGGFLYPSVQMGSALILHHPLDPALYLKQLQDERVSFTIAPPALLNRLAAQPTLWHSFDFSALRAIGSGSAPLSPDMIATVEQDYGKPIVNFYGSNEGIALFATPENAPSPELRATHFPRLGVQGMPWRGYAQSAVKSAVIDTDTGEAITEPGVPGELCFAGATVFDGYLGTDNRDVFTDDGFFRTGDLVEICGEPPHYYRIVGRCKDIINRGGMKISPTELDTLLEGYPGLTEVAVCGYPDDTLGEKICVCVVPAEPDSAPSLEALCEHLASRGIARFKHPERLVVLASLPRNPMGKVVRTELARLISQEG